MRILFVCTGNSFRSPAAEALAKKYRPKFEVESAGVSPAGKIASDAKKFLGLENCDEYVKDEPEPVTENSLSKADRVIVMERSHKKYLLKNHDVSPQKLENWEISDPIDPEVEPEESFDEIKKKIKNLQRP